MQCYYIDLYGEYDVDKILNWSKDLYNEYYNNFKYTKEEIKNSLEDSKKYCLSKEFNEIITFNEFLKRVEKYNDRCNNSNI